MNPDSLIFDMDGTLWDAVDTYAHCWTEVLRENGIDKPLVRNDIQKYMGMEAKQIYREIFPDLSEEMIQKLYADIIAKTDELLPSMGGKIYPDVQNSIKELSSKYKLFMLSNCQKGSIRDFMEYTQTKDYFVDYVEYGSNFQPKNVNIRELMKRHNLKAPIYIGDTDSDRKQADLAYIPFAFASWGFGKTHFYTYKFEGMKELTQYFMNLEPENEIVPENIMDRPTVAVFEDSITVEELKALENSENIEMVMSIEDLEDEIENSEATENSHSENEPINIETDDQESYDLTTKNEVCEEDDDIISENSDIEEESIMNNDEEILIEKTISNSGKKLVIKNKKSDL